MKTFIPTYGGYRNLISYQKAEIVYDATFYFVQRFLKKGDRTIDQMVQAARSGKQNIAEASKNSGTSKQMEITLTNVARASLEELIIDYFDFLRTRGFKEWPKDHPYAKHLRNLCKEYPFSYETFRRGIENEKPEICINVIIGLIKVTSYLLDQQIRRLEQDFLKEGGIRERMTKARLEARAEQNQKKK